MKLPRLCCNTQQQVPDSLTTQVRMHGISAPVPLQQRAVFKPAAVMPGCSQGHCSRPNRSLPIRRACSGHACSWMMAVMTFWTYYPYGPIRYLVVAAFVQSSLRTAVEGWHYSVDFLLPAIVGWYVYRELKWVCPETEMLPVRRKDDPVDKVSKAALGAVLFSIALAMINSFFLGA